MDKDPIYIRDGKVWSSAGVTAGIDLALTVARYMVMFLRRRGTSRSSAWPCGRLDRPTDPIRAEVEAIHADPGRRLSISDLAAYAKAYGLPQPSPGSP
ncbi:hypothetical protein [Nonomuraea sp. NPDC048826]|uniref:hypothetical protein n=1 Tax=Nonomuraea sp. NPDC048826 TaxID=3364347 RepID=UPI003719FF6F